MNSDNFDNLFKEQIAALDQVAIPGSSWSPDTGWEGVLANINKPRRKIIFWFSSAATIIILLGFYLLMYKPANNIQITRNETSGQIETPASVTNKSKEYKTVENTNNEILVNPSTNTSEKTTSPLSKTESRNPGNSIAGISRLSIETIAAGTNIGNRFIPYRNETLSKETASTKPKPINRTYVINHTNTSKPKSTKSKNFTFKLGSKTEPDTTPRGMLAGL